MPRHDAPSEDVVVAAQARQLGALEELSSLTLPLVYSVAARALPYRDDVDDVVQETMLRVLRGLGGLERPGAFRSWVIAITINEVRGHLRRTSRRETTGAAFDAAEQRPDPAADFAGAVLLELGLSDQRREAVHATRWLDEDDRELLALWWLETAGRLTRAELATTLQMTGHQAAVRVQRLKERLRTARTVVRALAASPACDDLSQLTPAWSGVPSGLWRKRLGRHVRDCPQCSIHQQSMLDPESLLAPLALLPVPAALLAWRLELPAVAGHTGSAATAGGGFAAGGTALTAKALVAVGAALAIGGAALVYTAPWSQPTTWSGAPTASPAAPRPRTSASPSSAWASPVRPTEALGPAVSRPPSRTTPSRRYGSVVDAGDEAPPRGARPRSLPHRPQTTMTMAGGKRFLDGYQLVHRGDTVTLSGMGYFTVHWDVMYLQRSGLLTMPYWTALKGKLFHVASGGGHRMDDPQPGAPADGTWMGNRQQGLDTLPHGSQQMWQNEHYYLDGSVTLHLDETEADYNLDVLHSSWQETTDDVTTPPTAGAADRERYGLVRDTGHDDTPVPQYATRSSPADPGDIPMRSALR